MGGIPFPYPTAMFDKLDEFMLEFEEQDELVEAGVVSVGDPAAYALVWEYGNVRQTKPGPKTMIGINPKGENVFLTIQRPYGYISIYGSSFEDALEDELSKVSFSGSSTGEISAGLRRAAYRAAQRIAYILSNTAPVDTGALARSFEVVEDGDAILDIEEDDSGIFSFIGGDYGTEDS